MLVIISIIQKNTALKCCKLFCKNCLVAKFRKYKNKNIFLPISFFAKSSKITVLSPGTDKTFNFLRNF